jgi:hypothetical protein
VGFLDPSSKDPSSCTIQLPSPNSNHCPSANLSLLVDTYISSGLNIAKGGFVPILSSYSSLAYRPPCVLLLLLQILWTSTIVHPIFVYVSHYWWLLLNLWRLGVIIPLDLFAFILSFVFPMEVTFVVY